MKSNLAQLNIARMKFALDDPRMADFVNALEPVNAQAEASPGFVWRLKTDAGDATSIRLGDDDWLLINLSIWTDEQALKQFLRSADHSQLLARREQWFAPMERPHLVLWWVAEGHTPTVEEAASRLDLLTQSGPTPQAFDFKTPFAPTAADAVS